VNPGAREVTGENRGLTTTHIYGKSPPVKTTVEIPDSLFREAKTVAASRGVSLKTFLTEALKEKLSHPRRRQQAAWPVPPPRVREGEIRRIQSTIDEEFSRIDAEEWK